jgi:hypothetical protein
MPCHTIPSSRHAMTPPPAVLTAYGPRGCNSTPCMWPLAALPCPRLVPLRLYPPAALPSECQAKKTLTSPHLTSPSRLHLGSFPTGGQQPTQRPEKATAAAASFARPRFHPKTSSNRGGHHHHHHHTHTRSLGRATPPQHQPCPDRFGQGASARTLPGQFGRICWPEVTHLRAR